MAISTRESRKLNDFFFEIGQLKRVKRSGWSMVGVIQPESIAERCFRAALIGYFLADKKGLDSNKVVLMLLMHDLPEARIGDMHKVAQRYIDLEKAERRVLAEQSKELGEFGKEYSALMKELIACKSPEAILARDADLLECAIQAREYRELGYKDAENWIINIGKKLKTKEAKQILKEAEKSNLRDWWENLKKV